VRDSQQEQVAHNCNDMEPNTTTHLFCLSICVTHFYYMNWPYIMCVVVVLA